MDLGYDMIIESALSLVFVLSVVRAGDLTNVADRKYP